MKVVIDNSKGIAEVVYKDKGVELQILSYRIQCDNDKESGLYVFVWDEDEKVDARYHIGKDIT